MVLTDRKTGKVISMKTNKQSNIDRIAFTGAIRVVDFKFTQIPNAAVEDMELNNNHLAILATLYHNAFEVKTGIYVGKLRVELPLVNLMAESRIKSNKTFYKLVGELERRGYFKRQQRGLDAVTVYYLPKVTACDVEYTPSKGSYTHNVFTKYLENEGIADGIYHITRPTSGDVVYKRDGDNEIKPITVKSTQVKAQEKINQVKNQDALPNDVQELIEYFHTKAKETGNKRAKNTRKETEIITELMSDRTKEEIKTMIDFLFSGVASYIKTPTIYLLGNNATIYPDSQAWIKGEYKPKEAQKKSKLEILKQRFDYHGDTSQAKIEITGDDDYSREKEKEKQEQEPPLNEEQKALLSNHTMTGGVYAIPCKNSSGHYPVKDKNIALQALNYIDNGILPDLKNQTVIQALTKAGYFSTEEAKQ